MGKEENYYNLNIFLILIYMNERAYKLLKYDFDSIISAVNTWRDVLKEKINVFTYIKKEISSRDNVYSIVDRMEMLCKSAIECINDLLREIEYNYYEDDSDELYARVENIRDNYNLILDNIAKMIKNSVLIKRLVEKYNTRTIAIATEINEEEENKTEMTIATFNSERKKVTFDENIIPNKRKNQFELIKAELNEIKKYCNTIDKEVKNHCVLSKDQKEIDQIKKENIKLRSDVNILKDDMKELLKQFESLSSRLTIIGEQNRDIDKKILSTNASVRSSNVDFILSKSIKNNNFSLNT